RLQTAGHVRPQLERFAIVGHSAGGNVSADLAALAAHSGLPTPRALMCVEPGKSWMVAPPTRIPLVDLSTIPRHTPVLAGAGAADQLAGEGDGKRIFAGSTGVPAENKDFVLVVSDDHGQPGLAAHHLAPCALAGITSGAGIGRGQRRASAAGADALDYYGFW